MPLLATVPVVLLLAAASCDLRWRIIPNGLTATLALGGLAAAVAGGEGAVGSILAGAGVLAGGTVLFALGIMGGGDVKLAAALALWLPAGAVPSFLVLTAVAGGLLGIVLVLARTTQTLVQGHGLVAAARSGFAAPAPYGVAIAAGGIAQIALEHVARGG